MNLFFIIDEHSDVEGEDVVRQMADIIKDTLGNPHKPRPRGEWIGGQATRESVPVLIAIAFFFLTSL
jgi:Delta6-protoilludene synthase